MRVTKLTKDELFDAIGLVVDSTYFTFNEKIYKQKFGTPMGSPLSPILADLVMRELEKRALDKIWFHIPLYYRYVDDIILAAPKNLTDYILDTFNSFHNRLQFTKEDSIDDCIPFLDVRLIVKSS